MNNFLSFSLLKSVTCKNSASISLHATRVRLANYVGAGRFLWNKVLALNLAHLENKQNLLWYAEMSFWLTLWKQSEEYEFLKEAPSQTLQQMLCDLERAFKDAFDKKTTPQENPKVQKERND